MHVNQAPRLLLLLLLPGVASLAGCRYGEMYDQPRYEAYDPSSFFDDGIASRPLETGVVPRSGPDGSPASLTLQTGRATDGGFVDSLPFALDREVLERGQNRYRIFCAPCHGIDGAGRGTIVERGFSAPPSLTEAKVRNQPVGYYYDVITHGHGAMYGYAARIPIRDRWSVAAFIRALQLSRNAGAEQLTEQDAKALSTGAAAKPGERNEEPGR
jgi:mono/diheme cytochrome c family protein